MAVTVDEGVILVFGFGDQIRSRGFQKLGEAIVSRLLLVMSYKCQGRIKFVRICGGVKECRIAQLKTFSWEA